MGRRRPGAVWLILAGFAAALGGLAGETWAAEAPGLPTVSLKVTREATSEPRPEARIAPAQIMVQRTGRIEAALDVLVIYAGTATPDLDYTKLPNSVTIPAGKEAVALDIVALDDERVEGEETVVAEIVHPPIEIDPLALKNDQLPLPTYLIDPQHGRAKVVIHDADVAAKATIEIHNPQPGDRFPAGTAIPIHAVAVDPNGAITRVEFFSGDQSIGVSEIVFIREPDPGVPIEHMLEWKDARPGEHKLTARGKAADGREVGSQAIPVVVGIEAEVVVLEVEATDAKAVEPTGGSPADVGVFVIRRVAGPRNVAVSVAYAIDGGAMNGVDYERLSGRLELPAGTESTRIAVVPVGDKAKEGEERVRVTLLPPVCPAIFPPPPQCYRIGAKESAVVAILDGDETRNQPPVARIVAPRSGTAFVEGAVISIRAEASDPDGKITRLNLLVDGRVASTSSEGALAFDWKEAGAGLHRLTATAQDDGGAESVSPVVTVLVRDFEEVAFVRRDLPPAYLPGAPLDVALVAQPPRGGSAWLVEEKPPAGWVVSEISDDGVFDATTAKVKFGPFTDTRERRLTYRVLAPAGATGIQTFEGRSSLDGESLPVVGDTTVGTASEHHPADAKPADRSIGADEVTAYAAAWKRGEAWGTDGGTIPAPYAARAGLIWQTGEAYRFDPAAGAPPACWIPTATASTASAASGRSLAGRSPGLAVVDVPGGVAERHAEAIQKPGMGGRVEIHIQPPLGTKAVAVEETVPAGWAVSQVSDDGVFDPATGKIRWGLFFGDSVRVLTFIATPPAGIAGTSIWKGIISFDGNEVVIRGVGWIAAGDDSTLPRINGSHREENGKVRLGVDAAPDQVLVVEGSDDLENWTDLGVAVHTGGDVEVTDADALRSTQRYYRLRPVNR